MSSNNLPSLLTSTSMAASPGRRDLARVDRAVNRDVALVRGRARVLTERGIANSQAIGDVSVSAMREATLVAQTAVALASGCPQAESALRAILDETARSMTRVVGDVSRDLRG